MTDPYLAVAAIANDQYITERMNAAATQQQHLGSVGLDSPALAWVSDNRYVWASSPSWGEKWRYALDSHTDDPDYEPGKDEAVITDDDILATVQTLGGPGETAQIEAEPREDEREDNTAAAVDDENASASS